VQIEQLKFFTVFSSVHIIFHILMYYPVPRPSGVK
jgi:hypothetical protein